MHPKAILGTKSPDKNGEEKSHENTDKFNNFSFISPILSYDDKSKQTEKDAKTSSDFTIVTASPVAFHPQGGDSDYSDEDDSYEGHSQADILENGDVISTASTKSSDIFGPKRSIWRKYRGMMLAILNSFIFVLSALLVKKLESFDPFNLALYKSQGTLLPAIPLLLQTVYCSKKGPTVVENVGPMKEEKKLKLFCLVVLRSFLAVNGLLLHFFSLKYISMGDSLTITSASPIFVALLARLLMGEKCGYSTIIASVCSLLGVVAIAKPPLLSGSAELNMDILIGSSLAFGCTLVSAMSFSLLRYIRKVHYSVTATVYGVWGSVESLIIVLLVPGIKIPSGLEEWSLTIGLAVLAFFDQIAITLAMKAEQAGPVALIRTCDVLFAFLLEIAVLKVLPDEWSITGATVIVLSVLFVGLRKWVRSLPKNHPIRTRLWVISM